MSKNKRVLLVEQSDASRQVAESILRQNGYEVISVSSSEKALEVVEFTRPDLLIVGSNLTSSGNKPLYERLQNEPRSSSVPLLVVDSEESGALPFPDEVVISVPLDSKDLLSKVSAFVGAKAGPADPNPANPLTNTDLEEDLLDSALGLDQLEVTDSEIMDKTVVPSQDRRHRKDSDRIGLDDNIEDTGHGTGTGKIESISIEGDATDIVQKKENKPAVNPDASGMLEIMSDQFGLESPDSLGLDDDADSDHDYNWFINEMRSDGMNPDKEFKQKKNDTESDSSELHLKDTSSFVDPITPPPATSSRPTSGTPKGVDHFIEEFKREVEKIQSEPSFEAVGRDDGDENGKVADMVWEEKLESLTVDQIGLFTRQFSRDLAENIAESIVNKIDAEKLLAMIKAEIISRARKTG